MQWIRDNKLMVSVGAAVLIVVTGYLAIAVFGVQTLFIDDEVSEENPFAVASAQEDDGDAGAADDGADETEATVTTLAEGTFQARSHPAEGTASIITDGDRTFLRFEDDFATDNGPDLKVYLSTAPPDADEGAFDDDFLDLGDLRGNIGSQNYEITGDVDLDRYQSVVVWCVRFGTAFGAAPLN